MTTIKSQDITAGDHIDLSPVFEEFGAEFDAAHDISNYEYAEVEEVSIERAAVSGEDGVLIVTDQHTVLVPVDYVFDM